MMTHLSNLYIHYSHPNVNTVLSSWEMFCIDFTYKMNANDYCIKVGTGVINWTVAI